MGGSASGDKLITAALTPEPHIITFCTEMNKSKEKKRRKRLKKGRKQIRESKYINYFEDMKK